MSSLNVVRVGQGGCGSKANFRSGRCQQRDRPARSEPFWVQACTATSKGVCASRWVVRWQAQKVSVGQGRGRVRRDAADARTGTCGAWQAWAWSAACVCRPAAAHRCCTSVSPQDLRHPEMRTSRLLAPLPGHRTGHRTGPHGERLPPASRALLSNRALLGLSMAGTCWHAAPPISSLHTWIV